MKSKVSLRKIIIGLSTVGMVAVTTTTSTYAWFKMSSTATVEDFDFNVVGGLGFMVSADGSNYSNSLGVEQIKKTILVGYNPDMYQIRSTDSDGNSKPDTLYKYDSQAGKFAELSDTDAALEIDKVMNKIKLLPTTSSDGMSFTNLYGATYKPNDGVFLEFSVYMKTTSDAASDKLAYDVYMNGYQGTDKYNNKLERTKFTSEKTDVKLKAAMNTISYDSDGNISLSNKKSGEHIDLYTSNAARISTTVSKYQNSYDYEETKDTVAAEGKKYYVLSEDESKYVEASVETGSELTGKYYERVDNGLTYATDTSSSLIYELNDTENLNSDLGSYSTDYDEETTDYSENYYKFSENCNAAFTYYNNLRSSENRLTALSYSSLPKNIIRTLPNVSNESKELTKAKTAGESGSTAYYPITTLRSGEEAQIVTFRIWLEGWDADCFDGLANQLDVRLAFNSVRVKY